MESESMFGGQFKHSVPDTISYLPSSDRESRKQKLKDEISKCMMKLEMDENNNNINNATTITAKSETHRPSMNLKPSKSSNILLLDRLNPAQPK